MKHRREKTEIEQLAEKELLSAIAKKFRNTDLFPKKTEQARQFLRKLKGAKVY